MGTTVRAGKRWFVLIPRQDAEAALNPANVITLDWSNNTIARIKPAKIGPGCFRSPVGDWRWAEIVPQDWYFDAWRKARQGEK